MRNVIIIILLLTLGGFTAVKAQQSPKTGTASYYASKFHGRLTASGERFDNKAMTAAHNTLPMGTYIKVTNLNNSKWVIVKVTDRLHAANRRVVDMTQAAAKKLGYYYAGLTKVKVEVVPKTLADTMAVMELASQLIGFKI